MIKYNPSTLSGALDIIVIEHPDGTLRSSPWHLRFGKLGLFHHTGKIISISINDQTAPFFMCVDLRGRGVFFESQQIKANPTSISYPMKSTSNVTIKPKDIRSVLSQSEPARVVNSSEELDFQILTRDSSVDTEACFLYEDPDPLPISTALGSIDLSQSTKSQSITDDPEVTSIEIDPTPSPVLLAGIRHLLNPNKNVITFTVSSLIQGPKTVTASLFLFNTNTKFIVSDVDGTVTSSDILGHFLPAVGKDWTHPGLVQLYSHLAKRGFVFIYLSSRPIGEAPLTRKMLQKIQQNGVSIPDGPLITCPDRLFKAFKREFKRKPHEFKIPALKNLQSLFPDNVNPIVFGFGNRPTDVLAYNGIGLKNEQVMLFDKKHRVMNAEGKRIFESIFDLEKEIDKYV
ncbi:putative lipin [Histomonas meleagridis]|uniref:putative lipin n=1 Tax=Histomonas meleagridis TaxID=135588 RepID=UPI003559EEDF|nr:putative lipin [Histomonas meleagridis]KAH0796861.1 putative lipin [Histomonas meleagridis]